MAIAEAGGIAPLVELVRGGSEAPRRRRRGRCMAANDANEVAIAEAGGIAPLVELVRGGSEDAKEHAAGALRNLAVNDANAAAIAAAGGVAPLEQLARARARRRPGDDGARGARGSARTGGER